MQFCLVYYSLARIVHDCFWIWGWGQDEGMNDGGRCGSGKELGTPGMGRTGSRFMIIAQLLTISVQHTTRIGLWGVSGRCWLPWTKTTTLRTHSCQIAL